MNGFFRLLFQGVMAAAVVTAGFAAAPEPEGRQIGVVKAAPGAPAASLPDTEQNWGIFVGINGFQDTGVPLLRFCKSDAEALYYALTGNGKLIPSTQSYLLVTGSVGNLNPTRRNILYAVQSVCEKARENSLIFISISTHGFTGPNNEAYAFPQDGARDLLADTAVSIKRINEFLSFSKASKKILIVDACREAAGSVQKGAGQEKMSDSFQKALKESRGLFTLASCDVGQISFEDPKTGHGVFSRYLLEGIQGAAPGNTEGFITVTTLSQYAVKKTEEWCNANMKAVQSPWIYGSFSRDIPLALASAQTGASPVPSSPGASSPSSSGAGSGPARPPAETSGPSSGVDTSKLDALLSGTSAPQEDPLVRQAKEYFAKLAEKEKVKATAKEEMQVRLNLWSGYIETFKASGYEMDTAQKWRDYWANALKGGVASAPEPPGSGPVYKTAFETTLGRNLDLGPIAVQAKTIYPIQQGPNYVLIKNVGVDAHDILVQNDGRCVVLMKDYIRRGIMDVGKAYSAFRLVVDSVLKPVRSDITETTASDAWYENLIAYTSQGNIYSRISAQRKSVRVDSPHLLVIPNIRVLQTAVSYDEERESYYHAFQIGTNPLVESRAKAASFDITNIARYGEHKFVITGSWTETSRVVLDFITEDFTGQFLLCDEGHNPIGKVMPACRPIAELQLPSANP